MTNEELRENAMKELWNAQQNGDTECAHGHADKVLCDLLVGLGYADVVTEFYKVEKWYA